MEWVIFSTSSLDGRIAAESGDSELSCQYDLELLHKWRCWSDLVLVGANTAIKDDPGLFVKRVRCRRQPFRGVVDGRLRVPVSLRLFREMPWTSLIITTWEGVRSYPWKAKFLKSLGVRVVVAGNGPSVDWGKARELLSSMGIRRVLVEGGGRLNWSLIKSNSIERLELTYVGRALGSGTPLLSGEGVTAIRAAPSFRPEKVSLCKCGRCVHVSWVPVNFYRDG